MEHFIFVGISVLAFALLAFAIFNSKKNRQEEEKYLDDPNAYMLATLDRIRVISEFVKDSTRNTMLFPYGSGIFCPQEKKHRNKVPRKLRLVYGLGKTNDGTLTVLSLPFGEPLPEGFDLEKNEGVPVTRYTHEFLEDLVDFIIDIYNTDIHA